MIASVYCVLHSQIGYDVVIRILKLYVVDVLCIHT